MHHTLYVETILIHGKLHSLSFENMPKFMDNSISEILGNFAGSAPTMCQEMKENQ